MPILNQIKGTQKNIACEAIEAARCAADIYIDTENPEDISLVSTSLRKIGLRQTSQITFGGNIKLADIYRLKTMHVDILGIGKEMIDAPLLNLKMEVMAVDKE